MFCYSEEFIEGLYGDGDEDNLSLAWLSAIARDTLVEPGAEACQDWFSLQFVAPLTAPYETQTFPDLIKGFWIYWDSFHEGEELSVKMLTVMERCKHFELEMGYHSDPWNGPGRIAAMIARAPYLHTLKLIVDTMEVEFEQLISPGVHWPNLRRLKLQGFGAAEPALRELLMDHSPSLRSLELVNIELKESGFQGGKDDSSWVLITLFLRNSLNLDFFRFGGFLSNDSKNEVWSVTEPDGSDYWLANPPANGSWLKHRIERFVVDGGSFPLFTADTPQGFKWHELIESEQCQYDGSWEPF